jgi:Fuc2NAc and GlcNAc transferase
MDWTVTELAWFLASLVTSALLTWGVRHLALTRGWLDVPNIRSSHTRPTARGGGIAIVLVAIAACLAQWAMGALGTAAFVGGALGGLLVAAVGYADDMRSLPAKYRFIVHLLGATLLVAVMLRTAGPRSLLHGIPDAIAAVLLILGTAWSINLFNFMDGIDGIASSQALFVSGASALLAGLAAGHSPWETLSLAAAGASLGFLLWNWPPAKVFMGDVGSGFLGYWLAAAALGLHVDGSLGIWSSVTLGAVFFADATATLIRRVHRGERWYEAHRSHAYQILSRRWGSHLKVTTLVWVLNLVVVLPLAYASLAWKSAAMWIALGLIVALAVACSLVGAGRASQ